MTAHDPRSYPATDLGWRDQAACQGLDPNMFTPEVDSTGPRGNIQRAIADAKAVCFGCPSRQACLDDANATGDDWTIRGGTTGEERRYARRRQLRAARSEMAAAA